MSAPWTGRLQARLGQELKRLRVTAGLSGRQLAPHLGIEQSGVSRIEHGQQRPSIQQVALWCKATDASNERTAELLALAEEILVGPQTWREASEAGSADQTSFTDIQPEIAAIEAKAGAISIYEPAAFPGLLQTAAYARHLISSGPDGELPQMGERIVRRIERQRVLYDETKHFRFVIPEVVLLWPYGPPGDAAVLDEHREQLAHIETVMTRPNVEIGVLPLQPVAVWRLAGFDIYDDMDDGDPVVHLGSWLTRPYFIHEPDQVEMCRQAFANLLHASATGDEARELIRRAVDTLRA